MISFATFIQHLVVCCSVSLALGFRPVQNHNHQSPIGMLVNNDGDVRRQGYTIARQSRLGITALDAIIRFKNFEEVLNTFHEESVVIYFNTKNCGPCQLMRKEVLAFQEMAGDELKMFSVDTEKWPQLGSRFDVARLPCLVVFREGEIKLRLEGVITAETVMEKVRGLL